MRLAVPGTSAPDSGLLRRYSQSYLATSIVKFRLDDHMKCQCNSRLVRHIFVLVYHITPVIDLQIWRVMQLGPLLQQKTHSTGGALSSPRCRPPIFHVRL